MILSSIGKLASNKGNESVLRKSFERDFRSDLMNLATKEIAGKIIYSSTKTKPVIVWRDGHLHIPVVVTTKAAGDAIARKLKSIFWLRTSTSSRSKRVFAESILKAEAFKTQMSNLNEDQLKIAIDIIQSLQIRTEILISAEKVSNLEKTSKKRDFKRLTKSVLKEFSFTPGDLGLKTNVKYSMKRLDAIVDHGISQHPNAIEVAKAILYLARNRSKRKMMVKSGLVVRDLNLIQKNFLIVAAAVSALHSNPKMKVMFHNDGFVLFLKNNPVGRFGKEIKKNETMKSLFEACRNECGAFPGKASAIMDVLDAEGKKKEHKLKELFNDFAKHMITNSSGPAAKAAAKLKKTAQITEQLKWNTFKKSFDVAAKHVREIDFDPMVKDMAKTVRELNHGRNVLNIASMRWTDIFRKKDLSWLGTLTADILEDEVNTKSQAVQALSCVANWMENNVLCSLNIKHVGSEGEVVVLTPCRTFKVHKWNIELQDIMKSGPKWKKV